MDEQSPTGRRVGFCSAAIMAKLRGPRGWIENAYKPNAVECLHGALRGCEDRKVLHLGWLQVATSQNIGQEHRRIGSRSGSGSVCERLGHPFNARENSAVLFQKVGVPVVRDLLSRTLDILLMEDTSARLRGMIERIIKEDQQISRSVERQSQTASEAFSL